MTPPDAVLRAVDAGALVVRNDSGGKDSTTMNLYLDAFVPPAQSLHIHATLGECEWPGAEDSARQNAQHSGTTLHIVQASTGLLQKVLGRIIKRPDAPCWPAPRTRYCTSDLKTRPIEAYVRRYADQHGFTTIINTLGLRADESKNRAQKPQWMVNAAHARQERTFKNGRHVPGRTWFDYLPIHQFTTEQVFGTIREAGRRPHHAYDLGNERMSCVFCLFASRCDLRNGAVHNPHLYHKYGWMEQLSGWALSPSRKFLPELTGLPLAPLPEELRDLEKVAALRILVDRPADHWHTN